MKRLKDWRVWLAGVVTAALTAAAALTDFLTQLLEILK